jgi:hypothetical protein
MPSLRTSRLGAAVRREIEEMTSVQRLVAAELLIGALVMRLLYIRQPIRHDEAYTYLYFASEPLGSALSDYSFPNNHIFHTILVRLVTSVLGGSLPAIRLPALVAGLLIVPAVYLLTRRLADRGAAILAMAPAVVWPELVHYSTDARGYSIIALAFLSLLVLGDEMVERDTTALAITIAVVIAIGMYTAPVMLYPGGAALVWIVAERFRRQGAGGVRALLPRLGLIVALSGALTLIAYTPILVRSGPGPLLANKYVVALTFTQFVAALPAFAADLRESLGLGLPSAVLGVFGIAAVGGALWPRDGRSRRLTLALSVLGWCVLLLIGTRRPPPARVWLFLVPLACVYIGIGLSVAVRWFAQLRRLEARATSAIAALVIAGVLAAKVVRSRAVVWNLETGSLVDAPEIASYLLARVRPGDRVVVKNPCDHPLDYYLLRRGHRRLREINAKPGAGRVFVVVEPRHAQTLEAVQSVAPNLPWSQLPLQTPLDTFPSARVYVYRLAAEP